MGTRQISYNEHIGWRDHPHACGDKCQLLNILSMLRGSSPRVWGQGLVRDKLLPECRIIPTRVGTSEYAVFWADRHRDHPHACGDKLPSVGTSWISKGSSPRVWGQVPVLSNSSRFIGIIPTRVGTSLDSLFITPHQ